MKVKGKIDLEHGVDDPAIRWNGLSRLVGPSRTPTIDPITFLHTRIRLEQAFMYPVGGHGLSTACGLTGLEEPRMGYSLH